MTSKACRVAGGVTAHFSDENKISEITAEIVKIRPIHAATMAAAAATADLGSWLLQ